MEKEANKNILDDSAADDFRNAAPHLSDEEIIWYQNGNFSAPDHERRAQNHLVECARCTNLLLELTDFTESATNFARLGDTDFQWARFEQKYFAESANQPPKKSADLQPVSPRRANFFDFLSFKFAATAFGVLALFAGATIFFALRNNETNDRSIALVTTPPAQTEIAASPESTTEINGQKNTQPENTFSAENFKPRISNRGNRKPPPETMNKRDDGGIVKRSTAAQDANKSPALHDETALNTETVDVSLYPSETLRGGGDEEIKKISVKAAGDRIRLKLNAPRSLKNSVFSLEITDSQNKVVLKQTVSPDKSGNFHLAIQKNRLPAAAYSLKLYAAEKNARKLLSEYGFRLEYE